MAAASEVGRDGEGGGGVVFCNDLITIVPSAVHFQNFNKEKSRILL